MAPDSAYQLYTLHGIVHGEAMVLAWALLANKTQATYVEMFTTLRDALISKFGDVGVPRTFLTDFQASAINAIKIAFPE